MRPSPLFSQSDVSFTSPSKSQRVPSGETENRTALVGMASPRISENLRRAAVRPVSTETRKKVSRSGQ
jgi:hypothetical protein